MLTLKLKMFLKLVNCNKKLLFKQNQDDLKLGLINESGTSYKLVHN